MRKIDKLKKYLDQTYITRKAAATGSIYYTSTHFNIRLSNHLPGTTNKTDMYILIPGNIDNFVISMGYSVYIFPSTKKVIEFIKQVEIAIPIVKGMKFDNLETTVYNTGEINKIFGAYKERIRLLESKIYELNNIPAEVINPLRESIKAVKSRNVLLTKQTSQMRELLKELQTSMDEHQLQFFKGIRIQI